MTTSKRTVAGLRSRILSHVALGLIVASGAGLGLGGEACAQQVAEEEDIVVTATRREQLLQDVPVAVTAFSGESLEELNIVNTSDLQRIAPSMTMQSSNSETGGSTIRIRGVGTTGNNIGLEGAVGVFIDGVCRQARSPSYPICPSSANSS
jgi:outer membrane receptor protein involved in Fe transport